MLGGCSPLSLSLRARQNKRACPVASAPIRRTHSENRAPLHITARVWGSEGAGPRERGRRREVCYLLPFGGQKRSPSAVSPSRGVHWPLPPSRLGARAGPFASAGRTPPDADRRTPSALTRGPAQQARSIDGAPRAPSPSALAARCCRPSAEPPPAPRQLTRSLSSRQQPKPSNSRPGPAAVGRPRAAAAAPAAAAAGLAAAAAPRHLPARRAPPRRPRGLFARRARGLGRRRRRAAAPRRRHGPRRRVALGE
jgi:hypothetical protein